MSVRSQKIHGRGGYAKADGDVQGRTKAAQEKKRVEVDRSPEGDDERYRMTYDYLHLYNEYMAGSTTNPVTGEKIKYELGTLQLLMMDFSLLDQIGDMRQHSRLRDFLPDQDENGNYPERWIYWRDLEKDPEIQDGPEGELSKLFYDNPFQGAMIRVCGNARTKCLLAPRNHLKSTCGQLEKQFRILRNPSDAHVIRTARQNLAKRFLNGIAKHWKRNAKFRQYWGHLVPEKREGEWSTETIQLLLPVEEEGGNDPTLTSCGNATEATGEHWKTCTLDDVVAKGNSNTPEMLEATRQLYSEVQAQRKGYGLLEDRGTRWSPDDAHGLFIGKPGSNEWAGSMAQYSCFMVATALDGDQSVTVEPLKNGLKLSALGYGKPIWDGFPLEVLQETRALMPQDRFYFGQYFNSFWGTSEQLFDAKWITYLEYHDDYRKYEKLGPVELAKDLRLNIFVAFDTARGKDIQTKTTDRTAGFVLGQTPDRRHQFFLGGFCEKLQKQYIPKGICDLCLKWRDIAREYGGSFRAGFEETAFTDWVGPMLQSEQRSRGAQASFAIEALKHGNRQKFSRIDKLVTPYFEHRIFWPKTVIIEAVHPELMPYDLCKILKTEFVGYHPLAKLDDLLDAHAYACEMALPIHWNKKPKDVVAERKPGQYSREEQASTERVMALGDYTTAEERTMGIE